MKAGDACGVLQTPQLLRWQRSRQRMGAPATLRLHLDVSAPRQAQDRYVAKNAFASVTEATDNVAWPLLKNQALTSSMNTWPPLAGCLLTEQRLSI